MLKNLLLSVALILGTTTLANAKENKPFVQQGKASWYGPGFHGRTTANGERYNMNGLTAAHRYLPFGTKLRVTCNQTGKSVIVRVNDRGPFHGNRVLDLSKGAAKQLGIVQRGVGSVKIEKIL